MATCGRLTYPRSARLASTADFVRVRKIGSSVHGLHLRLTAAATPPGDRQARFGVVTSRRVGPAVTRNKVRRRLREVIRAARQRVDCGWDVVTVAKPAAAAASFQELRDEWLRLAHRLSILRSSA